MSRRTTKLVLCLCMALFFLLLIGVEASQDNPAYTGESPVVDAPWSNPYSDVTEDMWSYAYITELNQAGILPDSSPFQPTADERRDQFVGSIYGLHLALGGTPIENADCPFADVLETNPSYDAICWAQQADVVSGTQADRFSPEAGITREQICTILMRFSQYTQINFAVVSTSEQFTDSLSVSDYARSYVVACKLAGLVSGYEDGSFHPAGRISRQECAAMVHRLLQAAQAEVPSSVKLVETRPGAYDAIYKSYAITSDFAQPVPVSAAVDASFFDKAVFIGDSVTLRLQYYCASTRALANTQFLCAGSLSASNALWEVSSQSVHPTYQGVKMRLEDGVAQSGADYVYIMLGVNNISFGLDRSTGDMVTLINLILEKSPHVTIIIQSATPMTPTSNIYGNSLNNEAIDEFNAKMREICQENNWYFLDIAGEFKDETGALRRDYCSDPDEMGIHFNTTAAQVWVDYLKTHVPETLR